MRRTILTTLTATLLAAVCTAQTQYPTKFSAALADRPEVRQALAFIDERFEQQIAEWITVTEIPGQSTHEEARAAYVRTELEKLGLTVEIDEIGNVMARRAGTGGGPTLVFAAHMDTVHPMDTDVTVAREEDGTLHAPGIYDNSASVANLLQATRAMDAAGISTKGDIILLFTVQEELGLIGMYHWLDNHAEETDMLVALDGGLGPVRYGALGIYWSKMKFLGDGAHTNQSRDQPHPARAAAQCITDIYTVPLPPPDAEVSAVYNVGMLSGGKVVNAIPEEAAFTVDLRTVDPDMLQNLDDRIMAVCEGAAAAHGVTFEREWIQRSEAGGRPEQLENRRAHPLVQTAVDVLRYLDVDLPENQEAIASGSTDSNAGVVRGIPSVSVGRGLGGDQHTLREWATAESARIGTKQIILLAVALTEPS